MRDMHLITTDNDGQEKVIQFRFGQAEEGKKKNERFFSPKLLIHPASKVGMLILSCSLGDCNYTMDDLQMLNYGIHKTYPIGSSENKAIRIKQLNLNRQENSDCNDEEKAKRVEKMQNLMKNIFGNEDVFNMKMFTEELMAEFKGEYERFDPYRLHVFTYLQTSDTDDKASLLNDFQRIIKIQNSNYKVSNCDRASYEQTFENIYVGSRSSMGAGNKLDATAFEVTDIYKTSVCPLAKVMRRELKARGIKNLKVVYSKEEPITNSQNVIGSVPFVPSVAGLIIAGEVIKELTQNV
jgi:predicted nucleic-acid-binding Zn-ribbon protein